MQIHPNIISTWIEWEIALDGDDRSPFAILIIATDLETLPGEEGFDASVLNELVENALETTKEPGIVFKRVRIVPVEEDEE